MQTVGLREGDEGDMAYWKETINNHRGDPGWREQPEEKKKKNKRSANKIPAKEYNNYGKHYTKEITFNITGWLYA